MPIALLLAARLATTPPPVEPSVPSQSRPELSWDAPAGCSSAEEVHARLQRLAPHASARAQARAHVEPHGTGFVESLEITVDGLVERRELAGDGCAELAQATALLVAIALDPTAVAATLEPPVTEPPRERAVVPSVPAVPVPVATRSVDVDAGALARVSASRPDASRPDVSPRWHVDGNAAAGMGWGSVPRVAAVVGASLAVERAVADAPRLRLSLDGRYTLPTTAAYLDRPALAARFDLWALSPRACLAPVRGGVSVPMCAGLELGRLRARASGTSDARTDRSPWIAATVDAALRWRVRGPWVVSAGFGIGIPLRRERFHFDERLDSIRVLHAVAPLTLSFQLGLGLRRP